MSLPQERSTAGLVSYTWVARSRSGSSSFTALALNKPSSSSSSYKNTYTYIHTYIHIWRLDTAITLRVFICFQIG